MEKIPDYMSSLFAQYQEIRGKSREKFPFLFWDVVVLTASDEAQAEAFNAQVQGKLERSELPLDVDYLVYFDPPGVKAGCGTATMYMATKLKERYGSRLESLRVMLINAGGQSQRMPSASVLGKLFMALPLGDPMWQVLDLKLASYIPFIQRMKPGFFLPASDTIEVYCLDKEEKEEGEEEVDWTFRMPGFTAIAHPSSLEIGSGHGVYVLDNASGDTDKLAQLRPCLQVLQKPTAERMRQCGAVLKGRLGTRHPQDSEAAAEEEEIVYTDSLFYFDHEVAAKLRDFYEREAPIECEIQSYSDFLQPLGPRATMEYTREVQHVSTVEPGLVAMRLKVFHLLHQSPLNVIALPASRFYHLGTFREYIDHCCRDEALAAELGLTKTVFSVFCDEGGEAINSKGVSRDGALKACVMHSVLSPQSTSSTTAVVEYSHFTVPLTLGANCIVSNCSYTSSQLPLGDVTSAPSGFSLPDNTFMHTIPVNCPEGGHHYVTIFMDVRDNPKQNADSVEGLQSIRFLGKPLSDVCVTYGKKLAVDLYPADTGVFTLWNARLFPSARTMDESFRLSHGLMTSLRTNLVDQLTYNTGRLWSMADVVNAKNVAIMLSYRDALHKLISNVIYKQ